MKILLSSYTAAQRTTTLIHALLVHDDTLVTKNGGADGEESNANAVECCEFLLILGQGRKTVSR